MSTAHPTIAPEYLDLDSAAIIISCSRRFIEARIADGSLDSILIGGRRLTTRDAIHRMMEQARTRRPRKGRGRMSAETRSAAIEKAHATRAARAAGQR